MILKTSLRSIAHSIANKFGLRPAKLPILFVHTPKTGGTSFRHAADASNKISQILCDYGKDNKTNAPSLNQARYHFQNGAGNTIQEVLSAQNNYMLAGHFSVDRYLKHFYPYQIGIFLRDPVQRLMSNYYHKLRKDQLNSPLTEYILTRQATNIQNRFIGSLPPEYFGFIGISERFEQSLQIVNHLYNLDLHILNSNLNPDKNTSNYSVPKEIKAEIIKKNKREIALYKIATKLLDTRIHALNNQDSATYGAYWVDTAGCIAGRAYRAFNETPAHLNLLINGQQVSQTIANNYNPIPCNVKQPRNGDIGFTFSADFKPNDADLVDVCCADSGIRLFRTKNIK